MHSVKLRQKDSVQQIPDLISAEILMNLMNSSDRVANAELDRFISNFVNSKLFFGNNISRHFDGFPNLHTNNI